MVSPLDKDLDHSDEEWADLPGWEGIYQISSHGRISSIARFLKGSNRGQREKNERLIKPFFDSKDRVWKVKLTYKGYQTMRSIKRLVAQVFVPNPNDRPEVAFIDKDRGNLRADNLKWVYHSQTFRTRKGISRKKMMKIRRDLRMSDMTGAQIARKHNVSPMTVSRIKNKVGWEDALHE